MPIREKISISTPPLGANFKIKAANKVRKKLSHMLDAKKETIIIAARARFGLAPKMEKPNQTWIKENRITKNIRKDNLIIVANYE